MASRTTLMQHDEVIEDSFIDGGSIDDGFVDTFKLQDGEGLMEPLMGYLVIALVFLIARGFLSQTWRCPSCVLMLLLAQQPADLASARASPQATTSRTSVANQMLVSFLLPRRTLSSGVRIRRLMIHPRARCFRHRARLADHELRHYCLAACCFVGSQQRHEALHAQSCFTMLACLLDGTPDLRNQPCHCPPSKQLHPWARTQCLALEPSFVSAFPARPSSPSGHAVAPWPAS